MKLQPNRRRALSGYTHDAYECCGQAPGAYGRPKGAICATCRRLIEDGRLWQEREALATEGFRVVLWSERAYSYPAWYSKGIESEPHRRLREAFFAVVNDLVSVPPLVFDRTTEHLFPVRGGRLEWVRHVLVAPRVIELLRELHEAIGEAAESAFQAGQRRGASILMQLAEGETTLSEFNQAAFGEKKNG